MREKNQIEKTDLRASHRMTSEDRRQQIIDVAVTLFSQKGFRGTTTKEIAQAAGVNEAIIFRHFATKSDLYAAIMDHKAQQPNGQSFLGVLEDVIASGTDREVFETIASKIFEYHEHDDTAMRLLLYSVLEGHELAEMIFRNHISRINTRLAEFVRERVEAGIFRAVDPMTVVRGFMGMVIGHVMHRKFFDRMNPQPLAARDGQMAKAFADLFLSSLLAERSQEKDK
jgi:AcrR family transcriptional regulator